MSYSWDAANLTLAAMQILLAEELQDDCRVVAGWVGNKAFGDHEAVLAIQAEPPRNNEHAAEVTAFTVPPEEADAITQAQLRYGDAQVMITANLYTIGARAKTRRAEMSKRIENLVNDLKPGYAPGLIVQLDTPEQPYCRFTLEGIVHQDTPEGVTREEWRTIIKIRARFALTGTVEAPYCRKIALGQASDELTPIDDIVPASS